VQLAILRWVAWAPGLDDIRAWREWAEGVRAIGTTGKPNIDFVDPIVRRRLSRLSAMAVRVAEDCLTGMARPTHHVFCSQFGEYTRSFELLQALSRGEQLSPMGFSVSVHNTASSYFSIIHQDVSPSVSIAGGTATLEAGFIEATALLESDEAESVLLVYAGEPLPSLYRDHESPARNTAAIGLLLSTVDRFPSNQKLGLEWKPDDTPPVAASGDPAIEVVRLISRGCGSFTHNDGRLGWTWNVLASQD
jgi:hypothetical protein